MTSKEKIRDIKSVINEFYHNEKCEGKLTECARKSWLVFQEYCDDILQDLERWEVLEKQMGRNAEIHTEVLLKNNKLRQENEKFKKAIEIIKNYVAVSTRRNEKFEYIPCIYSFGLNKDISQQEYELLKEVLTDD